MNYDQEKTADRKERADKLVSLSLPYGLFLNMVVLCGLSGDDHQDEQPVVFSYEAVVIMVTHDLGPCICFPYFLISFPFLLILVPDLLPAPSPSYMISYELHPKNCFPGNSS